MKFGELKRVINRHAGRHDSIAVSIGLGSDAIIEAESEILDYLDDYEVDWIAPSTVGHNTVTDSQEPCIDVHLKKPKRKQEEKADVENDDQGSSQDSG